MTTTDSQEQLELALALCAAGIWSGEAGALEWDEPVREMLGLAPGRTSGSLDELLAHVHPDDVERVRTTLGRAPSDGSDAIVAFRALAADGGARYLSAITRVRERDAERPARQVGVLVDRTAERRAREDHDLVLGSISSILIEMDAERRVTTFNAHAEAAFGIAAADLLGTRLEAGSLPLEWEPLERAIRTCLESCESVRVDEVDFARPDGTKGFIGLSLSPLAPAGGPSRGCLILARDITHYKSIEIELQRARKLESIGQLAAGVAHEINTPTQFISDNTLFLRDSFGDLADVFSTCLELAAAKRGGETSPERLDELIAKLLAVTEATDIAYLREEIPNAIRESLGGLERVTRIVQAIKEFSHPGSSEKEPIDLNQALRSTLTVAGNEWKYVAEVELDLDPDLPLVSCLPGEISQVFLNVVVNAAQAIQEARQAKGSAAKGAIRIATRRVGGSVEVRISDTGTGIPKSVLGRIFDPFFTTKEVGRGTGQGLAISHAVIVDKHGGSISAENNVGAGTTFVVTLPIEPACSATQKPFEEMIR